MHPVTPGTKSVHGSDASLSSSVGTLRSSRNASSPVGDAEGDTTSLTVFEDEPANLNVKVAKSKSQRIFYELRMLNALDRAQEHTLKITPRTVRCAPLELAPSSHRKETLDSYSKLSPKTPRQSMSPTTDELFKFVEDVRYEHNTAKYRRQFFEARLTTPGESTKRIAEARAGNVDYLRKLSSYR